MALYWEIAARSVYDMFSKYKYLIVNFEVFEVGISFGLRLYPYIVAYLYLLVHVCPDKIMISLHQTKLHKFPVFFFEDSHKMNPNIQFIRPIALSVDTLWKRFKLNPNSLKLNRYK